MVLTYRGLLAIRIDCDHPSFDAAAEDDEDDVGGVKTMM